MDCDLGARGADSQPFPYAHHSSAAPTLKRQQSTVANPLPKHFKLNCGCFSQQCIHGGTAYSGDLTDYVSLSVRPRNESIGLYSGETKSLFCITLSKLCLANSSESSADSVRSNSSLSKGAIVLKIKTSSPIRKILYPKSVKKGKYSAIVLIDDFDFRGGSKDILVQVADLSHELNMSVSAKTAQAAGVPVLDISPSQATCSIQRPKSDLISEDSPYVLAQLLRFAAMRVLQPDHEARPSKDKTRVKQVLAMISKAPAAVKELPLVVELQRKLESMVVSCDSWCFP